MKGIATSDTASGLSELQLLQVVLLIHLSIMRFAWRHREAVSERPCPSQFDLNQVTTNGSQHLGFDLQLGSADCQGWPQYDSTADGLACGLEDVTRRPYPCMRLQTRSRQCVWSSSALPAPKNTFLHVIQQVGCACSCSAFHLLTVSLTEFISPLWDLLNVNQYIGLKKETSRALAAAPCRIRKSTQFVATGVTCSHAHQQWGSCSMHHLRCLLEQPLPATFSRF